MPHLLQSDFLQALGKAIAASFWQIALLFLTYYILIYLLRIKQATIKNFFSTAFSIAGLLWFVATVTTQGKKQMQHAATATIENINNNTTTFTELVKGNRWQLLLNWMESQFNFIIPYLSIAYLFVLCWFMLKLFVQVYQVNSLRRYGLQPVNEKMNLFFHYLVDATGVKQNVKLFFSSQIDIPATIGFLKPIILLPVSAVTHLTPAQLEAVLLHEISHIKRNDYFWNLLLTATETILFFNPFALLLISIAKRERENSCDDYVMQFQNNAPVYAEALLNVEKARRANPSLAMALGDDKHLLKNRIKRILNLPLEKNKISSKFAVLVFFTLLFATTGWLIKGNSPSFHISKTIPKNEATKTIFINPETILQQNNVTILFDDRKKKTTGHNIKNSRPETMLGDEKEIAFDHFNLKEFPAQWTDVMNAPEFNAPFIQEALIPHPDTTGTRKYKIASGQYFNWNEMDVAQQFQRMQPMHVQNLPKQFFYKFLSRANNKDSIAEPFVMIPDIDFYISGSTELAAQNIQLSETLQQSNIRDLQQRQHYEQRQKSFQKQMAKLKLVQDSLVKKRILSQFPDQAVVAYLQVLPIEEFMKDMNEKVIIIKDKFQTYREKDQQLPDSAKTKKLHYTTGRRLEITRL